MMVCQSARELPEITGSWLYEGVLWVVFDFVKGDLSRVSTGVDF